MLLTIDLKGNPLHALAELLEVESKQIRTKDFYFGKGHAWTLRPTDDTLELRVLLEVHPLESIPAEGGYLANGGGLTKYVNAQAYTAHTALSAALLNLYQPVLDKAQQYSWLSRELDISCTLPPLLGSEEVFQDLFGVIGYGCQAEALDAPHLYQLTLTGKFSLIRLLWDLIMILPALDIYRYYWTSPEHIKFVLDRLPEYAPQHPTPHVLEKAYQLNIDRHYNPQLKDMVRFHDPSAEREEEDVLIRLREATAWNRQALLEQIHSCLNDLQSKNPVVIGVGNGDLLARLLPDPQFEQLTGIDHSMVRLQTVGKKLGMIPLPEEQKAMVQLWVGSMQYVDQRLEGKDAIILSEPLNLLSPTGMKVLEEYVFGTLAPAAVMVLALNSEHDTLVPGLPAGAPRHPRAHYSWDRKQLSRLAKRIGGMYQYNLHFIPVGPETLNAGPPAQLILFHHLSQLG